MIAPKPTIRLLTLALLCALALLPLTISAQAVDEAPAGNDAADQRQAALDKAEAEQRKAHESIPEIFTTSASATLIEEVKCELFLQGNKLGGGLFKRSKLPDGNFVMSAEMMMKMARRIDDRVETFEMRSLQEYVENAEGDPVWSLTIRKEADVEITTYTTTDKDRAYVTYRGPSYTEFSAIDRPANMRTSEQAQRLAIQAFEEKGESTAYEYSALNTSTRSFDKGTIKILKKLTYTWDGEELPAYQLESIEGDQHTTGIISPEALPYEVSFFGGALTAKRVKELDLDFEAYKAVFNSTIEVGTVIEKYDLLQSMTISVEVRDDHPELPPIFVSNPYQTVEKKGSNYRLTLHDQRRRGNNTSPALPMMGLSDDVAKYLKPSENAQSDDPSIQRMAAVIAGTEEASGKVALDVVTWVYKNLKKDAGARGGATAVEALAARCGDCTEHADLTTALCRAAGIPARSVSGMVYVVMGKEKSKAVLGYHAWSEVWLGEWVPVDAALFEWGTPARYIRMEIDDSSEEGNMSNAPMRLAGRSTFTVTSHKIDDPFDAIEDTTAAGNGDE